MQSPVPQGFFYFMKKSNYREILSNNWMAFSTYDMFVFSLFNNIFLLEATK